MNKDAFLSVDILAFRHRFKTAWSDKTPLKVSLICLTCTDENPGRTAYAAYGDATKSFGPWRSRQYRVHLVEAGT